MTVDIFMLALYLLVHFIVISMAVLVGLWLYYLTEWLMDKLTNNPLDTPFDTRFDNDPLPGRFYDQGRD